jgi:hypothetical protein
MAVVSAKSHAQRNCEWTAGVMGNTTTNLLSAGRRSSRSSRSTGHWETPEAVPKDFLQDVTDTKGKVQKATFSNVSELGTVRNK